MFSSIKKKAIVKAVLLVALWGSTCTLVKAQDYPLSNVGLSDLSFMVGRWQEAREGATLEETWSYALNGNMLGMCRFSDSGKIKLLEFLCLQQETAGPVLRIRHYNTQLAPWKNEEQQPLTCQLAKFSAGEAMFESRQGDSLVRITYKSDSADHLTVTIEKVGAGGSAVSDFHYSRVQAAGT